MPRENSRRAIPRPEQEVLTLPLLVPRAASFPLNLAHIDAHSLMRTALLHGWRRRVLAAIKLWRVWTQRRIACADLYAAAAALHVARLRSLGMRALDRVARWVAAFSFSLKSTYLILQRQWYVRRHLFFLVPQRVLRLECVSTSGLCASKGAFASHSPPSRSKKLSWAATLVNTLLM